MKPTCMTLAILLLWIFPARSQERQAPSPDQRAARITEWMKANLSLTAEQVPAVEEINKTFAGKTEDLRKSTAGRRQKASSLKQLDREKDEALKAVFTESQFKTYLSKKEELKEQVKQKMKEQKKSG